MDPEPKLVRYGSGRYVPTLEGDPGPVPRERATRHGLGRAHQNRLVAITLTLDEGLERAWSDLVREVRGTGDVQAALALKRFQLALEAFHSRPRV